MEERLIRIGKILSPHGVRGELRVFPFSDFPQRCRRLHRVRLEDSEAGVYRILAVERGREQKGLWILKLEGVDSRSQAEELKGSYLFILPRERAPLPEGSYYYDQIIGLKVYTREGRYLGRVADILPSGQDIYLVRHRKAQKEYMIPASRQIVTSVNPEQGRMVVDPPPGLLDL